MATTNVPQIQFSATGYVSPSAPSVLQGVQLDINSAFGQNLNFGLTTPQGQLSSSWGAIIANCNAQFVFLSQMMDPAYSVGKWQDGIGRIYYMTRKASQPTSLQISCAGANGVQIPLNALLQDNAGNYYSCVATGTIPASGLVTLSFACTVSGPVAVPQTVTIVQAISGWDSATVISGVIGSVVEGQQAFETRRQDSVAGNSYGPVGAIIGAVAAVQGVLDYYGAANPTASPVTSNGVTIAAYSTYICVAGGTPSAIAQAIWSKKSPGSPMTGNTSVTVYDTNPLLSTPVPYTIVYQIPSVLHVTFAVKIANNSLIPSTALTQVQNALISAFAGASLTANFTGSISGNLLTVTAISSGTIAVGQVVTDLTGAISANTTVSQLGTGTGGTGTYLVSISQTVPSEAMSSATPTTSSVPRARINSLLYAAQYVPTVAALGTWAKVISVQMGSPNTTDAVVLGYIVGTVMTVTQVTSGTIVLGDYVNDSASAIINGTSIFSFGTGTGGTGTYNVNNTQTVGATFTGTGSGTNLTASAVSGTISIGDTIVGSGVPGSTTIISQSSGTTGGAGVYVTSNSTTSSGAALSSNKSISCYSANQTFIQVNANQVPQLVASQITLTTS